MSTTISKPASLPSVNRASAPAAAEATAAPTGSSTPPKPTGWAPSSGATTRPSVTSPAAQPAAASIIAPATTSTATPDLAPHAKAFVDAFALDADPVTCSLATNQAADELLRSSFTVIQRELSARGDTASAVDLSKKLAAIPPAATDRLESMNTIERNRERLNQLIGLLGKFSAAIDRGNTPPENSVKGYTQVAQADLARAEVDFAIAFHKGFGTSGADPHVITDAQGFLKSLSAQVDAQLTQAPIPAELKPLARDEVTAKLLNQYAAKLSAIEAPVPPRLDELDQ